MKVKGIKRGQTIEILDKINDIPNGTEIIVDLNVSSNENVRIEQTLTDKEKLARLNKLFGAWKDQPELMEIFTEIDKDRHVYRG
ncbi:MAG: hypothetical protein PUP91_24925 [Rhizonema sp. PD37]|nr:hypothetical protein [Rhizonema sp. PD37]